MMLARCWNARWIRTTFFLVSVFSYFGCKTSQSSSAMLEAGARHSAFEDQYRRYLQDTLTSLEMMRGKTGLVKDSIWVCWDPDLQKTNFKDTEELTSPTNIGLDLILLSQQITIQGGGGTAQATLAKVLQTLSTIDYHHSNGMFFRTYWPDTAKPADINLSSVDNLHLAFGLWVTDRALRDIDPALAATARQLFNRMDFSDFFNEKTNLVGGNMRPVGENPSRRIKGDPQGAYKRDAFDYKYFGSEARSLYTLAWALGLYRTAAKNIADFDNRLLEKGIPGTIAEITASNGKNSSLNLLRTWDGGGFQALLPSVLMREEVYSPILGKLHHNYAERLLNDADTFGVPAAHSASAFGVRGLRIFHSGNALFDERLPIYNGAAGHIDMVATMHEDVKDPNVRAYWELAYTPHPAFMAATFARDSESAAKYAQIFKQNESLESPGTCICRQNQPSGTIMPAPACECHSPLDLPNMKPGPDGVVGEPNLCTVAKNTKQSFGKDRLYQPGLGWMDGYYINGPFKNRVIPVLISLDQSMVALSIYSILSPDGHYVGSKSLLNDPVVSAKLRTAYKAVDGKLANLPSEE